MENNATAKISYLRVTPRKARVVCDLVRGKKIQEALDILKFTKRYCAKDISKLISSALANANQKSGIDLDNLYVKTLMVDAGPVLKRSLPRARGMATPILKRTSHIKVVLAEK